MPKKYFFIFFLLLFFLQLLSVTAKMMKTGQWISAIFLIHSKAHSLHKSVQVILIIINFQCGEQQILHLLTHAQLSQPNSFTTQSL